MVYIDNHLITLNSKYANQLNGSLLSNVVFGFTGLLQDESNIINTFITVSNAQIPCSFYTITTTNNGTITLAGNGGVAPYQYSIDGVNFATNAFFNNLIGGIYSCEIMDGNGCVGVTSVVLDDVTGMSENQSKKGFEVSVFPNPSEDWITIESTTNLEENYQLLDAQGRILLKGKTNGSTTTVSLKAIKSGNYILKIGAINASIRIRKN